MKKMRYTIAEEIISVKKDCLRDMLAVGGEFGAKWCCAGAVSKKGHPHHPLYLRKDEVLKPFDIDGYLRSL